MKKASKESGPEVSAAVEAAVRNRMIGDGDERVDQIVFNPMNWRVHPRTQRKALTAELKKIGMVQKVIVNQRTGNLVDGHLRVLIYDELGLETIPVTYVDLEPEEELEILATFDKITTMAGVDSKKLDELTQMLKVTDEDLQPMVDDMRRQILEVDEELDRASEEVASWGTTPTKQDIDEQKHDGGIQSITPVLPGAVALKTDIRFKTSLPWDIPQLRDERLGTIPQGVTLRPWLFSEAEEDSPDAFWLYNWGRESMRGLPVDRLAVGFYVEDWRFEPFWERPDVWCGKMLNAGVKLAVSPNFSVRQSHERALQLYNTFRSRWLARYMQEAGFTIIPDVQWTDEESLSYCLLGLPVGAPMLSIQIQQTSDDELTQAAFRPMMEEVIKRLSPQELLLYGNKPGLASAEQVCRQTKTPFRFVPSRASVIQGKKAATRAKNAEAQPA